MVYSRWEFGWLGKLYNMSFRCCCIYIRTISNVVFCVCQFLILLFLGSYNSLAYFYQGYVELDSIFSFSFISTKIYSIYSSLKYEIILNTKYFGIELNYVFVILDYFIKMINSYDCMNYIYIKSTHFLN